MCQGGTGHVATSGVWLVEAHRNQQIVEHQKAEDEDFNVEKDLEERQHGRPHDPCVGVD